MVIKGGALRRYVVVGGMVALVTSGRVATASPAMGSATSATSPAAVPTAGPGSGLISTIAGGGPADGTPATAAAFLPWSVTAAAAGVYVSTRTAVFRVDGAGTLIRVAESRWAGVLRRRRAGCGSQAQPRYADKRLLDVLKLPLSSGAWG